MITEIHPSSSDRAEARKFGLCWHNERAPRWPCGETAPQAAVEISPEAPNATGASIPCPMGHRHLLPLLNAACWVDAGQGRVVAVTLREYDVANEILKTGAGNRAIGRKLYLSEDTIKSHIKKLLQRTGTATRTEFVVAVYRERVRLIPLATAAGVDAAWGATQGVMEVV